MTARLARPATREGLFLWIMHRFAEEFTHHAILKGGMALRLIDSPRMTVDIDYVFVPYESKRDIREPVESVLREIEGARLDVSVHSKMLRAEIRVDEVSALLEVNVALECDAVPMSSGGFAASQGQAAQVIRVMSPEWSLAHKLAAWNERRLLRDLYDAYFYAARLGVAPVHAVLDARLTEVETRLPSLATRKSMTRAQFAAELRGEAERLDQDALEAELGGLLPSEELAGLALRMRAALVQLCERLLDE